MQLLAELAMSLAWLTGTIQDHSSKPARAVSTTSYVDIGPASQNGRGPQAQAVARLEIHADEEECLDVDPRGSARQGSVCRGGHDSRGRLTPPACQWRARGPDHESRSARLRQPELVEGPSARAELARRLHPARGSRTLIMSASRNGSFTRGERVCTGSSNSRHPWRSTRPPRCSSKSESDPPRSPASRQSRGSGSVDTPRDVRGFAVKLHTKKADWDLVGTTSRSSSSRTRSSSAI